ncbi:hypothetical protein LLG90_04760 [Aromatoleum toluclasticum]|uniref:hypothetical protein n=1 Tax=Aromatoleum toluclasticum TaxID=92003 RepID=UPI001D19813F|nr:hypothetical protein [Aromatoleum toluclasticum]MCC4114660.1 hypothetical protein [Aromatoleum toluclasticum]
MAHQRKRAAPAKDPARQHATSSGDSTAPLYHPLTWRTEEPVRFRGKAKRNARRAAIDRKRQSGRIDLALIAVLVLVLLECLLIGGAT